MIPDGQIMIQGGAISMAAPPAYCPSLTNRAAVAQAHRANSRSICGFRSGGSDHTAVNIGVRAEPGSISSRRYVVSG